MAFFVAVVAAFAVAPTAASAARPPRHAADLFGLRGSDGYDIEVDINQAFSDLVASSPPTGSVTYMKLRRPVRRGGRTEVQLGRVGLFDYRFVPSGAPKKRKLGPRCSGRPAVVLRGTFVGTLWFRGENGYTEVSATRARGTRQYPAETKCTRPARRHRRHPRHRSREQKLVVLSAHDTADGVQLSAVRFLGKHATTLITADQIVGREGMTVIRSVFPAAEPDSAFTFDPELKSATLSLAPPFSGSATYTRLDTHTTRWEGSLAVEFPGLPEAVPLTGPKFSWSLGYEHQPSGGLFSGDFDNSEVQIIH